MAATLELAGVEKSFGATRVLHGIDLRVAEGEMIVVVGASGCGKSTLLRIVAGLEEPTAGRVRIGGRDVTALEPADRDVAMVFQNYALYPHMTVERNMAYGLRIRGLPKPEIARRVREAAELLGIGALLDRRPRQLSGGQRQRVAMGRAIVREPALFLFDEPLSNLDARLRVQMRAEIRRLQRRLGVTSLFVTHDQTEAMTLGDRLVVMHAGHAAQVADAHGDLGAAGGHLCRGLHRQPFHEPPGRDASPRRAARRGSGPGRACASPTARGRGRRGGACWSACGPSTCGRRARGRTARWMSRSNSSSRSARRACCTAGCLPGRR